MEKTKKMSRMQLLIITAVNMMGSGIIMLPAKLAKVGTMSILSWVITAGGSLCLAYAFARLGLFSKKGGGMGGYSEYALGKAGSFIANFTYGISLVIANVAIAATAVGYMMGLFNWNLSGIPLALVTIAVIWLTSVSNFGGPKITGRIGSVTVWGVIIPVIVLAVIGWFWFNPANYAASWNPHHLGVFAGASQSITITLWAFLGLESACANMDAVENPEKDVPFAVLGGTIIAAVMYIVSTNVIQGIVPNKDLAASSAPFGLAFAHMFSQPVGNVVMALMIIACIGSLLGWQFTVAEVFRSSAIEGYFPKVFKKVLSNGTPLLGLVILTIVQTIMALGTASNGFSSMFDTLVGLATITNLVPYVTSMAAVFIVQRMYNKTGNGNAAGLLTAMIGVVYSLYAIMASDGPGFGGFGLVAWGTVVTFLGWVIWGFIAHRFDDNGKLKES